MNARQLADLDRHITGNWGEDQFPATVDGVRRYEAEQAAMAKKAQRTVDGLLRRAVALKSDVDRLALYVENEIDAPSAVQNLMAAQESARMLIEALLCECSPKCSQELFHDMND